MILAINAPVSWHRLSNGGLETVSAAIHWVKKTARFRNVEYFKTVIYFHCRGAALC